eukprot:366421-Chlamydomonas_euryale.AAC.2
MMRCRCCARRFGVGVPSRWRPPATTSMCSSASRATSLKTARSASWTLSRCGTAWTQSAAWGACAGGLGLSRGGVTCCELLGASFLDVVWLRHGLDAIRGLGRHAPGCATHQQKGAVCGLRATWPGGARGRRTA